MTKIYDSPAPPWPWGPLLGNDIVAQQAEALVQRYDLLDALAAGGEVRRDLDPTTPADPRLREVIARQLLRWVDFEPVGGEPDRGWPIPQGVRLEALCYSSSLDSMRTADGTIAGRRVFALPNSAAEFARQFYVRSGIRVGVNKTVDPNGLAPEFQHSFRFTPLIVGEVAMCLRRGSTSADLAFRLLMSRHYNAACDADPRLFDPHPLLQASGFEDAAIVAFERLDEIARIGMIVREVETLAVAGIKLRALLEAANDPAFVAANSTAPGVAYAPALATALANDPAMLALCDYLAVGTDVLASWRNAVVADCGVFHVGFRPAAFLVGGSIESDTAAALSWMVDVRTAFLSAFEPRRVGREQESALQNDSIAKFYGLSNFRANLAAALMADFNATRPCGAPRGKRLQGTTGKNRPDDVRESLASITAHIGRDGNPAYAGLQTVRTGAPLGRIMLPKRLADGSAARADDSMCRDRYRDWPFWMRFQSPGPLWYAQLSMRQRDRKALGRAIDNLRELTIANLNLAPSRLTARVIADLATGVCAISINPAFTRSMRALVAFNGRIVRAEKRWNTLSATRQWAIAALAQFLNFTHGRRWTEQIEAISNPARLRKRKEKKNSV